LPWARALQEVKRGRIDALIPAMYTEERSQYLVYPEKSLIDFYDNVLLKRTGDEFQFSSVSHIPQDKIIAKVRSMSLGDEFDKEEVKFIIYCFFTEICG